MTVWQCWQVDDDRSDVRCWCLEEASSGSLMLMLMWILTRRCPFRCWVVFFFVWCCCCCCATVVLGRRFVVAVSGPVTVWVLVALGHEVACGCHGVLGSWLRLIGLIGLVGFFRCPAGGGYSVPLLDNATVTSSNSNVYLTYGHAIVVTVIIVLRWW